jgi:NTP pyrophosphatase (non-canonical NTP hydrolase)
MTHPSLVTALCKDGQEIKDSLTPLDAHLWHMVSALTGETGELLDCVKKAVIYRKPIDLENAKEELGDIEFYLEGLRQGLNLTREECLEHNIAKLTKRYGEKYSNQAAQDRKDKQ